MSSPYTKINSENKSKSRKVIYIIIAVLAVVLITLIALLVKNKVDNENFVGFNLLKGVSLYESSK